LEIDPSRIDGLRAAVNVFADQHLGPDDLKPRLRIDGAIRFRDISDQLASELELLAPYGAGNPRPIFWAKRVEVADGPRRIKERHLKLALRQDKRVLRGIAWRAVERETFVSEHRQGVDLAFSIQHDTWNGERNLQLTLEDFRAPE